MFTSSEMLPSPFPSPPLLPPPLLFPPLFPPLPLPPPLSPSPSPPVMDRVVQRRKQREEERASNPHYLPMATKKGKVWSGQALHNTPTHPYLYRKVVCVRKNSVCVCVCSPQDAEGKEDGQNVPVSKINLGSLSLVIGKTCLRVWRWSVCVLCTMQMFVHILMHEQHTHAYTYMCM